MISVNPYLNFAGNTEEAFNFYRSIFGGDFPMVMRFGDTPEAARAGAEDAQKLMHIALPLGSSMLMATDALESMGQKLVQGNNFHLVINAESRNEADTLYSKLSKSGKSTVPMADTFWGDYYGMLTDKFGIQWMISFSQQWQPK